MRYGCRKNYLLFLCRHCCSLHILIEWPMSRGRRQQRFLAGTTGAMGAREARGHSPTSRHHCLRVTATLETLTPVLRRAALITLLFCTDILIWGEIFDRMSANFSVLMIASASCGKIFICVSG